MVPCFKSVWWPCELSAFNFRVAGLARIQFKDEQLKSGDSGHNGWRQLFSQTNRLLETVRLTAHRFATVLTFPCFDKRRFMSQVFTHRRRIEFRETDMAGIVHFSNFFAYMEQAEHEFLRSVGMGVICEVDGQNISWPRVNAQCNYRVAIKFEEMIDIKVSVERIGNKSVTYAFDFFRSHEKVADGKLTAVCCLFSADRHGGQPESIAIPAAFVDAIKPYALS